ncbi:SLAP domain-containing protein [Companilactobacillus heilongjiangensis]|uniref:S-layer protein C-terminal domain-containing protein n=1 Tax=Companilactobacillus heilongjiangensis TaxID=1074467 RepID=A0A0K2LBF5_9LACO|nr:SLAP domain-containing protein [Companilactobacillus heilongjiangensis]ALB28624.1 hypothetical protein JP39_04215 [Companilactobacillus heilongjiangensis]
MKRRIMVAATGLSAGTLVAMSVVNPRVVSDLIRVERVKAEETETPKDITKMIPDPELRAEIARELKIGADELKAEDLESSDLSQIYLFGDKYSSLEGIEHITELAELRIIQTSIKDISMVSQIKKLSIIQIQESKVTNFDVLSDVYDHHFKNPTNINVDQSVSVEEDVIYLNMNDLTFKLSPYIGENLENEITINEVVVNQVSIKDEKLDTIYYPDTREIVIDDLVNMTKNDNGTYSGQITINLLQKPPFKNQGWGNNGINTTIVQPYIINMPEVDPGVEPDEEISNIEKIKETNIMTDRDSLTIYNQYGKKVGTKNLTEEITDFTTNRVNEVNGVKYYEIGDNEWVEADKVKEFYFNDAYIQTHASSFKELTKLDSNPVTDRVLAKNSDWYSDRHVYLDDKLHYRVSTHEWVRDGHVVQYESVNGVVHATETASLYNSEGVKVTDRALAKGSTFFADKKATIDGKLMYRVATDEWVDADTVIFK